VTLYVDASALAKLYVAEADRETAVELLRDVRWTVAGHAYVEVRRLLSRRLAGEQLGRARDSFERAWQDSDVVELDEPTCRAAAELAETTGAKTLDALHLAAAQRAGAPDLTFVTFDRRQADAARSLGWTVAGA
jgi:predicted nucleic acid-binding protein